jgi:hypothetical protein
MVISDGATYLNTGTWAELMALPRGILLNTKDDAMQELRAFLDDLAENKLDKWKKPLPTFAKLVMDGDEIVEQDVYIYLGNGGKCERIPEGRLVPLSEDVSLPRESTLFQGKLPEVGSVRARNDPLEEQLIPIGRNADRVLGDRISSIHNSTPVLSRRTQHPAKGGGAVHPHRESLQSSIGSMKPAFVVDEAYRVA